MRRYECISGKTEVLGVFCDEYVKIEDVNGAVFKIRVQELPKIMETFEKIINDLGVETRE